MTRFEAADTVIDTLTRKGATFALVDEADDVQCDISGIRGLTDAQAHEYSLAVLAFIHEIRVLLQAARTVH